MGFPAKLLNQDEEIVLDLQPHWWFLAKPGAALVGALFVALIVAINSLPSQVGWLAGILVVGAAVYFGIRYTVWTSTNFVVTDARVIYRAGVFAKQGMEIPLDRINTVIFNQSVFERLLGTGNLSIESASEGGRQNFHDIRQPTKVQQEIYRQIELDEQRSMGRLGAAAAANFAPSPPRVEEPITPPQGMPAVPPTEAEPAPADAPAESVPDQIERLARLHALGILTDEEFTAKKRELLDRM